MNIKTEEVETDDEMVEPVASSNDVKKEMDSADHTQSHEKRGYYEHLSMGTPGSDNDKEYISINNKVGKSREERKFRKPKTTIKVEAFPKIQHIKDDDDMDVVVEKIVPKDDWKEMHEEGNLNMVATDEHGKFIAAKITRNSVQMDLGGKRGYKKMRETLSILDEYKTGIKHSENDDGSTVYDMIGKDCKNPLKSSLFIFKEGTPDDIIRQAKDGVKDIVEKMETSGERVTKYIYDDNCFSYLSCLSKDEKDDDVLIYHFVFPEYKLKITMRSGDVIILNPSVRHSFSNCEQPAYLLSIFKEREERRKLASKKVTHADTVKRTQSNNVGGRGFINGSPERGFNNGRRPIMDGRGRSPRKHTSTPMKTGNRSTRRSRTSRVVIPKKPEEQKTKTEKEDNQPSRYIFFSQRSCHYSGIGLGAKKPF